MHASKRAYARETRDPLAPIGCVFRMRNIHALALFSRLVRYATSTLADNKSCDFVRSSLFSRVSKDCAEAHVTIPTFDIVPEISVFPAPSFPLRLRRKKKSSAVTLLLSRSVDDGRRRQRRYDRRSGGGDKIFVARGAVRETERRDGNTDAA